MNDLSIYNEKVFEDIKHIDEFGNEYWLARELQEALEYKENVVVTPRGEEIEAKRIFNFENLSTFDYCSYIKKSSGKDSEQGEKVRIENNNMVNWE